MTKERGNNRANNEDRGAFGRSRKDRHRSE